MLQVWVSPLKAQRLQGHQAAISGYASCQPRLKHHDPRTQIPSFLLRDSRCCCYVVRGLVLTKSRRQAPRPPGGGAAGIPLAPSILSVFSGPGVVAGVTAHA